MSLVSIFSLFVIANEREYKLDEGGGGFPIYFRQTPTSRYNRVQRNAAVMTEGTKAAYVIAARVNNTLCLGGGCPQGYNFAIVENTLRLWM